MFLSTENPPNDPLSSSSNFLHVTTSSDELGQSHLSNFSIRDYAYSNRKTNIKKNWPFSTKSLHLFSSHGVTDPLPPFQKFSTVTNQFETTASSSPVKQTVPHVHRGRDLGKLKLNQTIAETTSKGVCSQSRIVENGLFTNNVSKSIVVASTSNNNKNNHIRKSGSRGMVKSKEDSYGLVSTTTTTSETIMASKTCPICRTFSSASNTTLNAHIDQCLSVDLPPQPPVSSSKPNKARVDQCPSVDLPQQPPVTSSSKPSKPRAKPRMKVKTMVDIYATAKGCTLEDLDKRNGTKWASILSYTNRVVADKSQVSTKKRKVSSPVGVGPVYIDDKGQKLRILSEYSEKKTSSAREQQQEEDCSKENSKCSRKRGRGKKNHKFLKLTNHKANDATEIPECQSGFAGESRSTGRRRIYNERMLSKVSKKVNEKRHKFHALRDQLSENDDDSWSERDPIVLKGNEFKQKLRSEVGGRNKTLSGNKRAQSRSFRVQMSEKEKDSLRLKKSISSIQKDKYLPGKNFFSDAVEVSDASPRATSKRKLSPLYVANAWRRLSMPAAELKRSRLDFSEKEDEEETGRWEPETNREREMSDDDYVSGDNGEGNEVLLRSNLSSSGYDDYSDDDEETSEEEAGNNNKRANVLDKKTDDDDTGAEFYESDTTPSIEITPSERAMYYSEEVGDMIYGQGSACKDDVRFESQVGHGSLYVEVDTIPIPGPPGSFLPSPRDMGFDENLGNSSVITSQVQSSMDQLDRHSSESPISAVSNFAAGRLNFPTELSSSFRENLSYSTTPMSFSVPSHHGIIAEAEPITIDKTTAAPSRFRNSDHESSCCCQRKERNSECITLNHQASHLLQRRAASSSSMAMNLTQPHTCMDPNLPFEQSPYMIQQDSDLQSKFSSGTNLNNGVVPPSPNPVLRLMGKDLMVMNQIEADDEASRSRILTPTPQLLDPSPPCVGTGLYFNTSPYLRNSFESTHQPQTPQAQAQAQAPASRNNFDHVRYFSPS